MRKKVSEMTPRERVNRAMKGFTNEDAEDVAVMILGQLVAKKTYINDDEEYFKRVMKKVIGEVSEYRKIHSLELAASKVILRELNDKDE